VELDRDDRRTGADQSRCDDAGTGADIKDEISRTHRREVDKA
jgi:hypothetical protein